MKQIILLSIFILTACKSKDDLIKPEVKPLIEAVYASGYVVAENEYQVFSQAEGYLTGKLVEDGAVVKKGDPLFIIESEQSSSRYQLAKKTYDVALRNYGQNSPVLQELESAMKSAATKLKFDSINFVRYNNLIKQNATTSHEFDRMKLAYENSKNDYAQVRSRYDRTKNQLYIDLENAKSQLQITGDETGRYIIKSQINGKVFKTMKDEGELIRRGEAVAILGNDKKFYLELSVDEMDVERIKKDQEVLVKIDAFGGKIFNGRVDKIYPIINQQQQSIRVDAWLKDSLPEAYSGLAVEANIVIKKKDHAIVIPKSLLLPGDSVVIETNDGKKKIKITKGIETLDEVEVVEGLDSTQTLAHK